MSHCPCSSQKKFSDCCEPYLNGLKTAETPEKLMRSRYSAYSLVKIDYIQKTMQGNAARNFNSGDARRWASSVKWLGLTIINASEVKNNIGTVTFFARFSDKNKNNFIYEKSTFEKINGEWFYVDGITPTINRNDNCLCGSGKKFKQCCGF
ncbi:MAG TPA: YchJ family protein [Coxiellaceae bacterium]|nr:MAG: hypothetical protein A3E81_00740 [Gammaproteobacteria bacterium RIFCSPHIGHO2_12_FULL_36_30]HLB56686.1 YchJ family protein [Coxiellaceae bacterium]